MTNLNAVRINGAKLNSTVLEHLTHADVESRSAIQAALNTSLKEMLSGAIAAAGDAELAHLLQGMSAVDIAAAKDLSLRTLVAQQVEQHVPPGTPERAALEEAVATLSETTTVGQLLALDAPIKEHPLFVAAAQRATLGSLLATSASGMNPQLQEQFLALYEHHQGPMEDFWKRVGQRPELRGLVAPIQLTMQLVLTTGGSVSLTKLLQVFFQQGKVKSPQDLAPLSVDNWVHLINTPVDGQPVTIPAYISGATRQEQTANYAARIVETLRSAFPTAFVALSVARPPQIDLSLIKQVLARNPRLDPRKPLPPNVDWAGLNPSDIEHARSALEALRQELQTFPTLDYRALLAANGNGQRASILESVRAALPMGGTERVGTWQNPLRQQVVQFFANAPDFDLRDAHIDTYVKDHEATAFRGITDRTAVVTHVKQLRRVFQVTPYPEHMNILMGEGLISAHRINAIPQGLFVQRFADTFGGDEQARAIHAKAQYIHTAAMHTYVTVYQAINGVSPRVVGTALHGINSSKRSSEI